ncbi:MAG TPA: DUF6755 family protein [Vicinamibacteria bacterium]|nr:DUF6755 family protein [Vicinamibacteria bacterium]
MTRAAQVRARRAQEITLVYAVMACLAILVVLQFLLLSVAVEGFLGARPEVLFPSTLASGACFAAACALIRYVVPRRGSPTRRRLT